MFLIELVYKKPLEQVDQFLAEHRRFLDTKVAEGVLICSGRKVARDGGVIFVNYTNRKDAEALVAADPFHREDLADYRLIEFSVTKFDPRFECFIRT